MLGIILNKKYEIKSCLAESNWYELYLACETVSKTSVVLKILREEIAGNEEKVRLFNDEVRLFAKLSHPQIAQILDFDLYEGRPFLISEWVEGQDLRSWLQENPVSFVEAASMIKQIGEILKFAHEQGVHYRSIKQSNIFISREGKVKVLSFSLPRLKLVNREETESLAGVQSDLFFLGTTFFELLARESPIRRRGGINELWDSKLRQSLRIRHSQLDPKTIEKIVELIERTLTRDLSTRHNNHEVFLKDVGELIKEVGKEERVAKQKERKLGSASEVVDAIHGRINVCDQGVSRKPLSSSQPLSSLMQKPGPEIQKKSGSGGTGPACSAALAVASLPNGDESNMGKPLLKIIKGGKEIARNAIWGSSDDIPLYRNPILMMGSGLLFMISLILFW